MEITIIEGARGTGKSSLSQKIRSSIPEQTLINFTGFHADGEEGLNKVTEYYDSWGNALLMLVDTEASYIFDRYFFSEAVYSKLYKEYDFSESLKEFKYQLGYLINQGVKIRVVFLTIEDEEELSKRLNRDKVPFGKAQENVLESLKQQDEYRKIFDEIKAEEWLEIIEVSTDGKDNIKVYEEVKEVLSL